MQSHHFCLLALILRRLLWSRGLIDWMITSVRQEAVEHLVSPVKWNMMHWYMLKEFRCPRNIYLGGEKGRTCYECFRQPEVFMAPQVHLGVWAATLGGFHLLSASTTFLSTWTWLSNILLHTDPIGSFFGFKSVPVEWLEPRCVPACKCADLIQFENWCNYPNIHGNRSAECNSCFFSLFFKSIGRVPGSATNLEFMWFQSQYSTIWMVQLPSYLLQQKLLQSRPISGSGISTHFVRTPTIDDLASFPLNSSSNSLS